MIHSCESKCVTKYYGGCQIEAHLWIIMGCMSCISIKEIVAVQLMKEMYISIIISEILIGLGILHGSPKIHNDIKTANVLANSDCDVKLAFDVTPFWMRT